MTQGTERTRRLRYKDGRWFVRGGGDVVKFPGMTTVARLRVRLEVEGLTGTHAVRAAWTALTAVPGIVAAEVSMAGILLEVAGVLDEALVAASLDAAGVRLVGVVVEHRRGLPIV